MSYDADTTLEPSSVPLPGDPVQTRKAYTRPQLQEWGSLFELTRGEGAGDTDAEGGGS